MPQHPAIPAPLAPISWGELIDKITILEIKSDRFSGDAALKNVRRELALLSECADAAMALPAVRSLAGQLKAINERLWDIEARLRSKESAQEFDGEFIKLARSVMSTNDERAQIKRKISQLLGADLIEEKHYGAQEQKS
jgi:hypothetical protein